MRQAVSAHWILEDLFPLGEDQVCEKGVKRGLLGLSVAFHDVESDHEERTCQ